MQPSIEWKGRKHKNHGQIIKCFDIYKRDIPPLDMGINEFPTGDSCKGSISMAKLRCSIFNICAEGKEIGNVSCKIGRSTTGTALQSEISTENVHMRHLWVMKI